MKKFKSFIPLALGLLTFASCSNDDLLEANQQDALAYGDYDMIVYHDVPNIGSNFTRAYAGITPLDNYTWKKTDRIRVFDDELHKYDIYYFKNAVGNAGGFVMENGYPNVNGNAAYALFPHEDVVKGYWVYNESSELKKTVAEMQVDENMIFDATIIKDKEGKTKVVYKDVLPQWGSVTINTDGKLEAKLLYLTAGARIPISWFKPDITAIRVQVKDPATGNYLPMAGVFTATLSEGTEAMEVNLNASLQTMEGQKYADAIYVDLQDASYDLGSVSETEQNTAYLYVPLPVTKRDVDETGTPVIIEVSATKAKHSTTISPDPSRTHKVTKSNMNKIAETEWFPIWKSKEPIVLQRNQFYGPKNVYSFKVGGIDTNAINEALEEADPDPEHVITLETSDVITICDNDNTIIIPKKHNNNGTQIINIDMSNGLTGCKKGEKLHIVYEDPAEPFTGQVNIFGAAVKSTSAKPAFKLLLDTDLPVTSFSLGGDSFDDATAESLDIDAQSFSLGNGLGSEEALKTVKTAYKSNNLLLSDNVEELAIAPTGKLSKPTKGEAIIKVGSTSKMKKFNVFGVVEEVAFDAHVAGQELDVTVSGDLANRRPGVYVGEIRTTGKLIAQNLGIIVAAEPTSATGSSSYDKGGVAAIKDVQVRDKSFIIGSIFSQEGDIDIQNVDANPDLVNGVGTLGDYIYERLGLTIDVLGYLGTVNPYTYGPLYAEGSNNGTGRVLISAQNSKLTLAPGYKEIIGTGTNPNSTVSQTVANKLNQHAQDATKYSVYANKDIQISGDQVICEQGTKMWAENDIHLSGKTLANKGNQLDADHDFIIDGEAKAATVNVGHDATVTVDPQNGNADAIATLKFKQHETDVNKLQLNQGYIGAVNNGSGAKAFDVELWFDDNNGAYAAIGSVTSPDNLLPMNESKWNGEQIPDAKKTAYVKGENIWTATQLAAQTQGTPTTDTPFLRSNINLMNYDWDGISTGNQYTFEGNNKYVKNFAIVSGDNKTAGFIDWATAPVTVQNLTLEGVTTNIAAVNSKAVGFGTGAVVGRGNENVTINRVNVTLGAGNFGSDGTNNIRSANIGGALGAALGMATLNGVSVDASQATITGYHSLGGLIGRAAGGVLIKDAAADISQQLAAVTTKVIAPSAFQVTLVDVQQPLKSTDLNQGKTGLYIGSADLSKSITITTAGNTTKDAITVTGANETVVWENGEATYGNPAVDYTGKYSFNRMELDGKTMIQTMIGQSGITKDEFDKQKSAEINGIYYRFFRGGQAGVDLVAPLYNVSFIDATPKN